VSFGVAGLLPVLGFVSGAFTALVIIQAILLGITAFTVAMVLHSIAPRRLRAQGRHRILTRQRRAEASRGQVQERDPAVAGSRY
jgi:hypothetical protein